MSVVQLDFPVLIENRKNGFTLTPLLMEGPRVSRPRYGDTVRAFQQSLKKRYDNHRLDRTGVEEILWYCFKPEFTFEIVHLAFKSGLYFIDGHFACARYQLNGQDFICLPKLNYLTLRLDEEIHTRSQRIDFICAKVAEYIRDKRSTLGEAFRASQLYSNTSDSTSHLSVSVSYLNSKFPFDSQFDSMFSFFGDQREFRGSEELAKTAEDWLPRFPDDLDIALFREWESDWLSTAVFADTEHARPGWSARQPVVLVGPSGVGKTNLMENAYLNYLQQHSSRMSDRQRKIWQLDPLRVISGMSVVGQWERRFEAIIGWVKNRLMETYAIRKTDILYVDNPVALFRIGKSSQTNLTLANVLKPFIERREFSLVLEATPNEWQLIQQLDRGFADQFQVLRLEPMSFDQLTRIYIERRAKWEQRYDCKITSEALATLLRVEPGFRSDQAAPGSVLKVIKEICLKNQNGQADVHEIYRALQANYRFRVEIIDKETTLNANDVRKAFEQRLVGQPDVCEVLTATVMSIKAQLNPLGKPLNSLLFIGPTGVGKTEAAKLLTETLFDSSASLVRFDLNEYVDPDAVNRLIGDGYRQRGLLTERIQHQKACVLLLDEIEKAHYKVHDLLLQILDDGRLTDALGQTVDFTQCVIIMTSNIGAKEAASQMGFARHQSDLTSTYRQSVERFFRPELVNRINEIVVFESLQTDHMQQLANLQMRRILARDGFVRRNTILSVDTQCLSQLAAGSYDPHLGARALKRNLERTITRLTAQKLAELGNLDPILLRLSLAPENHDISIRVIPFVHLPVDTQFVELFSPNNFNRLTSAQKLIKYQSMVKELQHLEDQLFDSTTINAGYWQWHLSDLIKELKEPLQAFTWEYEDKLQTQNLTGDFAYRPAKKPSAGWRRSARLDFASLNAQQDLRDYLYSLYQKADQFLEYDMGNWTQLQADYHQAKYFSRSYIDNDVDSGCIVIRGLISGQSAQVIDWLSNVYQNLLGPLLDITAAS
ncbi:MAG: AAA family ATPase, partial [Pseudomonadales bacterium]|nr:AAA family ATPase [Pseudomonadales bacterium]